MTFKICRTALLASGLFFTAAPAFAQEEAVLDIRSVDCRTMLKMDEGEQDFTLIFLHGFMSGKTENFVFNGPEFKEATDAIIDACIDKPTAKLLDIFGKHR